MAGFLEVICPTAKAKFCPSGCFAAAGKNWLITLMLLDPCRPAMSAHRRKADINPTGRHYLFWLLIGHARVV
jgi:hypothetical protein